MSKLNLHTPTVTPTFEVESKSSIRWLNLEKLRRLVVLIPANTDFTMLSRRIWELANSTNSSIQLLSLCKDGSQEPRIRRELVTLSALIQDAKVSVETKVEIGTSWIDAVKRNYEDGDMIVCIAEQTTGIRRQPLSQILASNLKAPVYILSRLYPQESESNVRSQITAWLGFFAIMIGFFIVQAKVIQTSSDWGQTVVLILLLIPEFGLMWVWSNLFS